MRQTAVVIIFAWVPASPMQIVQAHIMCEDTGYMRDYVLNEEGDIKALWFNRVEP